MLEIGPATDAEREWSAQLMARSEPWTRLGRDLGACRVACGREGYLLLVARESQRPCGFILLHPRGAMGSPYVASIAVAEQERGRAIGTRLLDFAEQQFRAEARHIFLCV
jgi:ribosomal protein S18 acetylase RimI-like enzyme